MNGCLQIYDTYSHFLFFGPSETNIFEQLYFLILRCYSSKSSCSIAYIIIIDCFLEQIWKIHYFDKMEHMSKTRWIQCFSLRKYGPFIHKLELELLWNFDILANMIFRFIWSVWILGVYGKSILGTFGDSKNPPTPPKYWFSPLHQNSMFQ